MGVSSRIGTFGIAKQSAKGSAASTPTMKFFYAGQPSLMPNKERGRFDMTDSGRDQGNPFTSLLSAGGDVPLWLHPDGISLPMYLALGANADTPGTNEVQTVTVDATGGTFTLTFRGQTTTAIAENAAASGVQTALEALTSIGTGNVGVAGAAGGPYTVTFQGLLGSQNVDALTGNGTLLTGGTGLQFATTTPGVAASHIATPANDLPWFTCWRMVGNNIFEKYVDCKLNTLGIEGNAGQGYRMTLGILGITALFEAADMGGTVTQTNPYVFPESKDEFKFGAVAQRVHQLSWSINNGIAPYQADDYFPSDIDPGGRTFTLSVSTRYATPTAFPNYRKFFYGSDVGTALDPVVGTDPFSFKAIRGTNNELGIVHPAVSYGGVPVQPDTGGAPIEIQVACEVEKPASGPICTVTTRDRFNAL